MTAIDARLVEEQLDPNAELARLIDAAAGDGALVTFVGLARGASSSGKPVDKLVLRHHPRLTQKSLDDIARDAAAKFSVSCIAIAHRCGELAPGEPIVFVGTSAPHRRAAFEAADYLMDRLKTEAVFWKREDGPDGSAWIEPTHADYSERARWG
jgi:molybdopterin synthase catalytic subunit